MRNRIILLTIHLAIIAFAFGQAPTAHFVIDDSVFCSSGLVQMIDQSNDNGTAITRRYWTYGDGGDIEWTGAGDNLNTVSHVYTPGIWTVTLKVCNGPLETDCNTKTLTDKIKIYNPPNAEFTVNNTAGCIPFDVEFTNTSTATDGAITDYLWGFGDGSTSDQENITHNYSVTGDRTPSLTVTDTNGCDHTYPGNSTDIVIEARDQVNADFYAIETNSCNLPFSVNFKDTSNYEGLANFSWDYGDGNNGASFNHIYTQEGNYDVKLIVSTDGIGCIDSISKDEFIKINIDDEISISADAITCPNAPVNFTLNSDWPVTAVWNFGDVDNSQSTSLNPSFTYSSDNAGIVTVSVSITNQNTQCQIPNAATFDVTIKDVTAKFSMLQNEGCSQGIELGPTYINNTSSNATAYNWEIKNKDEENNILFVTNFEDENIRLDSTGIYDITLTAISEDCEDIYTITDAFNLAKIEGDLETTGNEDFESGSINDDKPTYPPQDEQLRGGCIPLTLDFIPNVDFGVSDNLITSIVWDFDGGAQSIDPVTTTSDGDTVSNTFEIEGEFIITATVSNGSGCSIDIKDTIQAGFEPNIAITIDAIPDEICDNISLSNYIENNTDAEFHLWEFYTGEVNENMPSITNSISNYDIEPDIIHDNNKETYNVRYTAEKYGCINTITYPELVKIKGPILHASGTVICGKSALLVFNNYVGSKTTIDAETYEWKYVGAAFDSYNDGDNISKPSNPETGQIQVNSGGDYYASITVTGDGCTITDTILSKFGYLDVNYSLNTDSIYCPGEEIEISFLNLGDDVDSIRLYVYEQPLDEAEEPDRVIEEPAYNPPTQNAIYEPDSVLSTYRFTLGEPNTDEITGYYDISASYYNVELGCATPLFETDSIFRIVSMKPRYIADKVDGCPPLSVNFNDQSSGDFAITDWNWSFNYNVFDTIVDNIDTIINNDTTFYDTLVIGGDSSFDTSVITSDSIFDGDTSYNNLGPATSANQNPLHTFNEARNYGVILEITDIQGCSKSLADTTIRVTFPQPNFEIENDTVCFNRKIGLRYTGSIDKPYYNPQLLEDYTMTWDYDDGSARDTVINSEIDSHTYAAGGLYTIKLIAKDRNGCKDSITKSLNVQQPSAYLYTENDRTKYCPALGITFNADSSSKDITELFWAFGDGNAGRFDTTEQFTAFNNYQIAGNFDIQLIGQTSVGCLDTFIREDYIQIAGPIATILVDTLEGCRGMAVEFSLTEMEDVTGYIWDFGDGTVDNTSATPVTYNYNQGGDFNPSVQITDQDPSDPGAASCTYSIPYKDKIYIHDINSDFSISQAIGCKPLDVSFGDSTTLNEDTYDSIQAQLSVWTWYFEHQNIVDARDTIKTQNTSYSFPDTGIYSIKLVAEDLMGCKDSTIFADTIDVYGSFANFKIANFNGCDPLLVEFEDSSFARDANIVSIFWQFGDNNTDSMANTNNLYTIDSNLSRDSFNVSLLVEDARGCKDSLEYMDTVSVSHPRPSFNVSDTVICLQDSLALIDNSDGIALKYYWYEDKNISTDQTLIDSADNNSPVYYFQEDGIYDIKLILTDTNSCKDSLIKTALVDVHQPVASFTNLPGYKYCPDTTIQFIDSSYRTDIITQWKWWFGQRDSITITDSSLKNYTHTFEYSDTFDVRLEVTTFKGCKDDTIKENFLNVEGPFAILPAFDTIGCEWTRINFEINDSNNISEYRWIFDDGDTSDWIQNGIIQHAYKLRGKFAPYLEMKDGGTCLDTIFASDTIEIENLTAKFAIDTLRACLGYNFSFSDESTTEENDVPTFQWSFGDGDSSSTANTTHQYLRADTFTSELILYSNSSINCIDTMIQNIIVDSLPIIYINDIDTLCQRDTVELPVSSVGQYTWTPNETISSDTIMNPMVWPDSTTNYHLSVKDNYNCVSDTNITIHVTGINLDEYSIMQDLFAQEDSQVCAPFNYQEQANIDNVNNWKWLYSHNNDSSSDQLSDHLFDQAGSYQVTLIAYHGTGNICTDTVRKTINVDSIPLIFSIDDDTICIGDTVFLNTNTSANYQWSPSNYLIDSNALSAVSVPQTNITYLIAVNDNNGCNNSEEINITVLGMEPDAFNVIVNEFDTDTSSCLPLNYNFNNTAVASVESMIWDFGNQDNSTNYTIDYNYETPGIYTLQLITGTGLNSACLDTFERQISVDSIPIIRSITQDTVLCIDSTIRLNVNDSIGTLVWSDEPFINGQYTADTSSTNNPFIVSPRESYRHHVILYDSAGCYDTSSAFVRIYNPGIGSVDILPRNMDSDTVSIAENSYALMYSYVTYPYIENITYEWFPRDLITCISCTDTTDANRAQDIKFLGDIIYGQDSTFYLCKLIIRDEFYCLLDEDELEVLVKHKFTQEVPDAFSPNGDGINDELFVRGWGIEELLEFRIYNRWGEIVFETADINEGWDGTYKGEPVSAGTYIYTLKAKSIRGVETQLKKGDFLIIR